MAKRGTITSRETMLSGRSVFSWNLCIFPNRILELGVYSAILVFNERCSGIKYKFHKFGTPFIGYICRSHRTCFLNVSEITSYCAIGGGFGVAKTLSISWSWKSNGVLKFKSVFFLIFFPKVLLFSTITEIVKSTYAISFKIRKSFKTFPTHFVFLNHVVSVNSKPSLRHLNYLICAFHPNKIGITKMNTKSGSQNTTCFKSDSPFLNLLQRDTIQQFPRPYWTHHTTFFSILLKHIAIYY